MCRSRSRRSRACQASSPITSRSSERASISACTSTVLSPSYENGTSQRPVGSHERPLEHRHPRDRARASTPRGHARRAGSGTPRPRQPSRFQTGRRGARVRALRRLRSRAVPHPPNRGAPVEARISIASRSPRTTAIGSRWRVTIRRSPSVTEAMTEEVRRLRPPTVTGLTVPSAKTRWRFTARFLAQRRRPGDCREHVAPPYFACKLGRSLCGVRARRAPGQSCRPAVRETGASVPGRGRSEYRGGTRTLTPLGAIDLKSIVSSQFHHPGHARVAA